MFATFVNLVITKLLKWKFNNNCIVLAKANAILSMQENFKEINVCLNVSLVIMKTQIKFANLAQLHVLLLKFFL